MLKSTGQAAVVLPDNVCLKPVQVKQFAKVNPDNNRPVYSGALPTGIFTDKGVKAKCAFRQQTRIKTTLDKGHLDLRFQNQHSFYAEKES